MTVSLIIFFPYSSLSILCYCIWLYVLYDSVQFCKLCILFVILCTLLLV